MTKKDNPLAPSKELPATEWEHFQLYKDVREAISCLPVYFRTETHISGIMATDLHTLNTVLGATIEEQVVRTLNLIRNTWDPDEKYALYSFVRQAQTFPDVLLRKTSSEEILLGVELKGWYLLAKEAEPSLRFQATSAACAKPDLIVVVPWVLGNVISGSPILFEPFIESAKYAADYRNYHWQYIRETKQGTGIEIQKGVGPYPSKSEQILDKPHSDGGGNFGRLARTGMMDSYIAETRPRATMRHQDRLLAAVPEGISGKHDRRGGPYCPGAFEAASAAGDGYPFTEGSIGTCDHRGT